MASLGGAILILLSLSLVALARRRWCAQVLSTVGAALTLILSVLFHVGESV